MPDFKDDAGQFATSIGGNVVGFAVPAV